MFEAKEREKWQAGEKREREIYPNKYLNIPQENRRMNLLCVQIHDWEKLIVLFLKVSLRSIKSFPLWWNFLGFSQRNFKLIHLP